MRYIGNKENLLDKIYQVMQSKNIKGNSFFDFFAGIIRPPLPPLTSLYKDPIRTLRAVRFASKLDFSMSRDLLKAMHDPGLSDFLCEYHNFFLILMRIREGIVLLHFCA